MMQPLTVEAADAGILTQILKGCERPHREISRANVHKSKKKTTDKN